MPLTYRIDKRSQTIFVKGLGDICIEELMESYDEARTDPDFDRTFNTYLDFSEIAPSHNIDLDQLESAKSHIRSTQEMKGLRKWGIYAPEGYAYSFSQMFVLIARELVVNIRVFRDENEARTWLGLNVVGT